jgi:hypothetical protein
VVGGRRNLPGEEAALLELVRDEVTAWRGRRTLFGFSDEDVEESLRDLAEMEAELVAEELGPGEEDPALQAAGLVCPVCQSGGLAPSAPPPHPKGLKYSLGLDDARHHMQCGNPLCGLRVACPGGAAGLEAELEAAVEAHDAACSRTLLFAPGPDCLLALCDSCDFCHSLAEL